MTDRAHREPAWLHWAICALILLLVGIAYANTIHDPFIFDDYNSVVTNTHIRVLWPLSTSMTEVPGTVLNGRPLVCFSFALNYHFASIHSNPDGEPIPGALGFHLVNIAFHMAAALTLFGLIRRTLLLPRWEAKYDSIATTFSAAVALIWAVHPIQTESVTYITQRTEGMMGLFLLLMFYGLVRAAESSRPLRWMVMAVLACAAGMGCKEAMVVAPLLALLYHWIFLAPRTRDNILFIWLYAAMFLTTAIVPIELHGADWASKSGYGTVLLKPFDYLMTQAGIIIYYLSLCFWPRGLVLDYFDWPIVTSIWKAILPGSIILLLLAATVVQCVRRHWSGFLGVWFFFILAPTSSFMPIFSEVLAERRMYLPLISVLVLVFAGAWKVIRTSRGRMALVAPIVMGLTLLTISHNSVYQTPITLWSYAVKIRPANARAHFFLGLSYAELRDWDNARMEDLISLDLSPTFKPAVALQTYILAKAPHPRPSPQGTPPSPAGSPAS